MFKKSRYFSPFIAALFFLNSCSKEELVELTPEYSLNAITNPSSMKQVEEVLLGTYSGFRNANYYGSGSGTGAGWSLMPDVLSDNLYEAIETLANSRAMADWIYQPNTGQISTLYAAPYSVIAGANIVLRDVDKFTTSANQLQANRIKGQAYVIRALAHFDLFRYFAVTYDRNSTTDLALFYNKEFTVSTSVKPARVSNKDYYNAIFADLSQAITLLGNVDNPINSTGLTRPFLDLAAAYAVQARVNLYAQQWVAAAASATAAINLRPLPAINRASFAGMYNQTSVGDLIWNVQFESGQSGPTFLVYFATSSRSYFRPAPEIAVLDSSSGLIKAGDIRLSAFFSNVGGRLAVTKYKGKGTTSDGNANFPAIRTGEMYLIRAEAYAMQGGAANETLAMANLNTLRAARIIGYTSEMLTGAALLTAIANERRRELFAEGHRFFDLKRTTRTINRGSACGTALSVAGDCMLLPTDREWALPIPETVLNSNENLKQNPNY